MSCSICSCSCCSMRWSCSSEPIKTSKASVLFETSRNVVGIFAFHRLWSYRVLLCHLTSKFRPPFIPIKFSNGSAWGGSRNSKHRARDTTARIKNEQLAIAGAAVRDAPSRKSRYTSRFTDIWMQLINFNIHVMCWMLKTNDDNHREIVTEQLAWASSDSAWTTHVNDIGGWDGERKQKLHLSHVSCTTL